jgi:type II secretory pathway pseudopilin PulG
VRRVRDEGGFGIVELMIALLVMAIGITAIVAGFTSGIVALQRANQTATAGTLADRQMEAYRALPYSKIALSAAGIGAPYTPISGNAQTSDYDVTACASPSCVLGTGTPEYVYCNTAPTTFPAPCTAVQTPVTGPDGHNYRVDTYIVWYCAVSTLYPPNGTTSGQWPAGTTYNQATPGCLGPSPTYARQTEIVKQVTVVVRDATNTSKVYVHETSTFDPNT